MQPDLLAQIHTYCAGMSSPEPLWLQEIVRYTWLNTTNPRQLSGHLQGRFLSLLSQIKQPNSIVEVGTFTGYSALCLAEGLAPNGHLHTIEADAETAFKAKLNIAGSPYKNKITVHNSTLATFLQGFSESPDLIFIDADKQGYQAYFEACYPILANHGLMLFDNTLWNNKVLDAKEVAKDPDTANMHNFNTFIQNQQGADMVLLPLRDGLTAVLKKA